jgi:hypothetical protein
MMKNPYRDLHALLIAAGWIHGYTGKSHHRYTPPPGSDAKPICWGSSPSKNSRSMNNARAAVRRALRAQQP